MFLFLFLFAQLFLDRVTNQSNKKGFCFDDGDTTICSKTFVVVVAAVVAVIVGIVVQELS